MAGSPLAGARLALVRTLLVCRALLGRRGRALAVVVLERGRRFRFLVADPSELEVLREVFLEREYELELAREPAVVVDLGSNIGATISFFRARYPRARIVGLEPDPSVFERLQVNVGDLGGVTVLPVAAAAADGRRAFYPAPQSWLSSLNPPSGGRPAVDVETRQLDSLLAELAIERVDLLKVDVEGAEEEILPGFAGLDSVGAVVGEIHPDVVGDAEALVRLLEQRFELEVDRTLPDRWRFKGVRRDAGE